MSENQFEAYEAKRTAYAARRAELFPTNKAVLFNSLAAADIHSVTIHFDGYSDSGQIESVVAFTAEDAEVPLPAASVEIRETDFDTAVVSTAAVSVSDYIERVVYNLLEETHAGWENDEGAFGEIRFLVPERSIRLEYNERYTETHYHEHEF